MGKMNGLSYLLVAIVGESVVTDLADCNRRAHLRCSRVFSISPQLKQRCIYADWSTTPMAKHTSFFVESRDKPEQQRRVYREPLGKGAESGALYDVCVGLSFGIDFVVNYS